MTGRPGGRARARARPGRRPGCRGGGAGAVAHDRPLVGEGGVQHPPPVALAADQVVRGHGHVGEEHLVEVRLPGDLDQRPDLDAGLLHGDDEVAQPAVLGHVPVGAGDHQRVVGRGRARGPHLLPVDDPAVAVADRGGAHRGQVGARPGLAVEQAGGDPPGEQVADEVGLEPVSAVLQGGVGADVVLVLAGAGRVDGANSAPITSASSFGRPRPYQSAGQVGTA